LLTSLKAAVALVKIQTHFYEFVEADVHQPPGPENLQHLVDQVPGDGLHQPQGALDRVLGVPDLAKVIENGLK